MIIKCVGLGLTSAVEYLDFDMTRTRVVTPIYNGIYWAYPPLIEAIRFTLYFRIRLCLILIKANQFLRGGERVRVKKTFIVKSFITLCLKISIRQRFS